MNIVVMGCVQFSHAILSHLLMLSHHHDIRIVGVVTRSSHALNSDFMSLIPVAQKNNIPYFEAKGNDQKAMAQWLSQLTPDVIYCVGWSYLLEESILSLPKHGVVGYHPSELPRNRGRHPLIWSLALGLDRLGSSFFKMDEGMDSGPIIHQTCIAIDDTDDATSLYQKMTSTACEQITAFTPLLKDGRCPLTPQDHSQANYWRKRTMADGLIDWRMSACAIHNLVRALTKPYGGAHFNHQGKDYQVWKTQLVEEHIPNIEYGKIIEIKGPSITVKCGEGVLCLKEHTCTAALQVGDYL